MKKIDLYIIFFLFILQLYSTAQPIKNDFSSSRVGQLKYEITFTKNTIYYSVKDEFSGIKNQPVPFALSCSGIAILSMGDDEVQHFFLENKSNGASDFFNFVNDFGDSKKLLAAYGGLYLTGWILKKPQLRLTTIEMFAAYGISGLITSGIKQVTGRARPYLEKEQYYFIGPKADRHRYFSFPSGHATISFSTATVLAQHTENKWLKAGLYSFAGAISTGRMYKNQHWFTDVLTGSLIGYFTGKIVVKVSEKLRS